ncbi:response regulator [bacterium]|nr:response regulator [bacterium]
MKKLLIVDDAKLMRNILKKILLEDQGYIIFEAENGEEAVQIYKTNQPDLVTMDLIMGQKNGLEAAIDILAFDRHAKIIMVTSLGQEKLIQDCIKAGVKDFIVKPFTRERVQNAVSRILDSD